MTENLDCLKKTAIVLPSLDPDVKFSRVLSGLLEEGFEHIVIVNDGSSAENLHWFEEAAKHEECVVLHHEVNKGKGRALKNAFGYVLENLPDVQGVITIDGDGQHLLEDIVACGQRMLETDEGVVLGCRDFNQPGIPPRSIAGNKTTSRFFRLLFNIKLADTQTGLRAIPAKYLKRLCEISGERFEYETNMLLNMKRMGIPFIEQPIATVYDPDDYSSHYNAVKDSMRIFKVMLSFLVSGSGFRYVVSGVCSWLLDNLLYFAFMSSGIGLGVAAAAASVRSQIYARALSSVFNFNMNTFYVFRSRENYWKAMLKYYCLCIVQTFVSVVCLTSLVSMLSISAPIIATVVKVVLEIAIMLTSYYIQKKWVFKGKR